MTKRNAQWGDLLRRANRGEAAAYARFLTEVVPVIRNIARARSPHGADEVEDIVQEVLLALHAKRHTWRESDPVTPWLYAIVRYKTADAARKRRAGGGRQVPIDDLADVLPDDTAGEVTAAGDLTRLLRSSCVQDGVPARQHGLHAARIAVRHRVDRPARDQE